MAREQPFPSSAVRTAATGLPAATLRTDSPPTLRGATSRTVLSLAPKNNTPGAADVGPTVSNGAVVKVAGVAVGVGTDVSASLGNADTTKISGNGVAGKVRGAGVPGGSVGGMAVLGIRVGTAVLGEGVYGAAVLGMGVGGDGVGGAGVSGAGVAGGFVGGDGVGGTGVGGAGVAGGSVGGAGVGGAYVCAHG